MTLPACRAVDELRVVIRGLSQYAPLSGLGVAANLAAPQMLVVNSPHGKTANAQGATD